jgi:hypothetical protein
MALNRSVSRRSACFAFQRSAASRFSNISSNDYVNRQNRELAIIYTSEIDGSAKRVSENLSFDRAGRVVTAEVFHGVTRHP